jgi:hypothetical protein
MNRIFQFSIINIIILFTLANAASANEVRAFHTYNQLPFKQIFGLPSLDNSPLTEPGTSRFTIISNISNTYDSSLGTNEAIVTDVETLRTSLILSYAALSNLQLGIEIPYVRHSGGFLADFIYDWHDIFNMPQNGRTKTNSDQLQIQYLSTSGTAYTLTDSGDGIGDIRLNCSYTRPWNYRSIIFSSELKLPTGDFDKLTGSGGMDFSAGLTINDAASLENYNITLFGGLAAIYLDDIDGTLSIIQNNFALTARAGIGWQPSPRFQLKLQMDTHSPLYDSDIKELGDPGLQIAMGGSLFFSENDYIDLYIAEDLDISSAADVAFQLTLVLTF